MIIYHTNENMHPVVKSSIDALNEITIKNAGELQQLYFENHAKILNDFKERGIPLTIGKP